MDEHQRRVSGEMLDKVAAHRAGDLDLGTLVQNLQGLMGAADFMDSRLIEDFWLHAAPIDAEHELRTEPWAPAGAASDEALSAHLDNFVAWVRGLLDNPSQERA